MANKNRNSNQPRRKRNKKPVKRYSEEYSNRPNPYTGYSADGNFHPEAKKHTLDEASVAADSATAVDNITEESINDVNEISENDSAVKNDSDNRKNTSGRRKKNVDRNAEKTAQQEKNEARRAAVSKIAQGVAAHSVSEQIIEDIASLSDVMESMEKADSTNPEIDEQIASSSAYDDLTLSETDENANEADEENEADIALPVILEENEVLPFDRDSDSEAEAENKELPVKSEDTFADDAAQIPPLNPADLIPVLDFDKTPAPVLNFTESAQNEISDDSDEQEENTAAEPTSSVTIEDILAAVEKENLDSSDSETTSESREFGFGSEMIFDTSKSEDWDSIIIPPEEDAAEDTENLPEETDAVLKTLLEACFNNDETAEITDDEKDIFAMSDDGEIAAEVLSELNSEISPNEYSAEEMFDITENISDITAEAFGEDGSDENQISESTFDISDDNSSKSVSEDDEVVSVEDDEADEQTKINETEAAVNAKLQKLVEAAELAELVRAESEEAEIVTGGSDRAEKSIYDLAATDNNDGGDNSDMTAISEASEEVREYMPKTKPAEAEEIFESVLIVDDGTEESNSDDEAESQDSTLFLRAKATDECPTAIFKLPEGPIILPTDIDDGDFQEQWLDDEEDSDEMASRSKRARRRISAFIGAVTILFVLVGAIWILKTAVIGLNSIGSTSEKKVEYTQFISPVVLTDPEPFESVEGANNQMLLESAIWSVLVSKDESSDHNYEYDDTGKIVLPAVEVEEAGKKLFGNDIKLNMDVLSETDGNVLYYYDSIEDKFHITTGGIIGPSAGITKIAQKSDYVSLIVGYYSQADMNSASSDEVEAYKYMEYVLSLDGKGEYHIESVRDYVED